MKIVTAMVQWGHRIVTVNINQSVDDKADSVENIEIAGSLCYVTYIKKGLTRLHIGELISAEATLDDSEAVAGLAEKPAPKKRRRRTKKEMEESND